mmetsp:Transcript_40138/g.92820  ORF Transcript_40138/g.92820 Transcript_40138/m.92820 type:complete len:82 (+) Transcript_40138:225-470(+)
MPLFIPLALQLSEAKVSQEAYTEKCHEGESDIATPLGVGRFGKADPCHPSLPADLMLRLTTFFTAHFKRIRSERAVGVGLA